jgi:hypothetical protein
MEYLEALPHPSGLKILKDKLYEKLEHGIFELIDSLDDVYYTDNVHRIYFDSYGVLTITFVIPKDKHFEVWSKKVRILANDGTIITEVNTPEIQFVTGVGGEQIIKLAVSGQAGEVVFKKDEYLTFSEVEELFLENSLANINLILILAQSICPVSSLGSVSNNGTKEEFKKELKEIN